MKTSLSEVYKCTSVATNPSAQFGYILQIRIFGHSNTICF